MKVFPPLAENAARSGSPRSVWPDPNSCLDKHGVSLLRKFLQRHVYFTFYESKSYFSFEEKDFECACGSYFLWLMFQFGDWGGVVVKAPRY